MKKFILALALFILSSIYSIEIFSETPNQFATVKEVIENFHDYTIKEGTFKIIKAQPLHIQLSPTILGSPQFPDSADEPEQIEWEVKHTLVYGIYIAFIHTPIEEITVTSIPMVFNVKTHKHKYLSSYQKTLTINRLKALEKIQKFLPIISFAQLKTDEIVPESGGLVFHDQWTKEFNKVYYNDAGSPGLDIFFNELFE